MRWLGLDIGGANLKAADGQGFALSRPFALWQRPGELPAALVELLAASPPAKAIAVTMTGELADCFLTKAEGVKAIVDAVAQAAADRPVSIYLTNGTWCPPEQAVRRPLLAAASNWHALAVFAGRFAAHETALLIDIGSTTCDLIPLAAGRPAACGSTDPERMALGELVYTGIERSPVCAVRDSVPWRGRSCPVAQELFATMRDVYLLLGDLPEQPDCTATADGRPATQAFAHVRLARSICADGEMLSRDETLAMARAFAQAQLELLSEAADRVIDRLPERPGTVVLAGAGEFLARRVIESLKLSSRIVSLSETLGPAVSRVAPAHALAVLARETQGD